MHPPGTVFDYNNADYIILGKIVEAVHGRPFDAVLAEHILGPLNMAMSGMLRQPVVLPQLADTYFYRDELKALCNDLPVYMENWYASGGMYSTAAESPHVSRKRCSTTRWFHPRGVRMMTHTGLDDYGYGVWVDDITIDWAAQLRRPPPGPDHGRPDHAAPLSRHRPDHCRPEQRRNNQSR